MSARPVSCLAKAVKSDETIEYSPDINDVMKWHKIFNKEIFKNRCPKFNSIVIRKRRDTWGECYGHQCEEYFALNIERFYGSLTNFLQILAHEMIHAIEYNEQGKMAHGQFFWSWKNKLAKKGLELKDRY